MFREIIIGLLLIHTFCSTIVGSESQMDDTLSRNKNILKVETFAGGIQFEHRICKRSSFQMSVIYGYRGLIDNDYKDFQVVPEYRYYLSEKEWPAGFFVGSYAFFKNYIVARDMDSYGSKIFSKDLVKTSGIGLKVGYQWLLVDKISFDISMGLGYNIYCDVLHKEGVIIIEEDSHYFNFSGMLSFGYLF